MAGMVKFYQGSVSSSLPLTQQNGAIFIIERDEANRYGDMYVDMENGHRLQIRSENHYTFYTPSMSSQTSRPGMLYLVTEGINETQVGVKIGDGNAFVGDLPTYRAIEITRQEIWNSKVDAFLASELTNYSGATAPNASETLVLTRDFYWNGQTGSNYAGIGIN